MLLFKQSVFSMGWKHTCNMNINYLLVQVITYLLECFRNSIYMRDCPFCCKCLFALYQLSLKDTIHNKFEPSPTKTSSLQTPPVPASYKQCLEYFISNGTRMKTSQS